jgi:predicted kinase
MSKLIVCVGIPGSGKTFFAKQYVKEHQGTKRINQDDLRKMIDPVWTKDKEAFIRTSKLDLIRSALTAGYDVISDDTNLNPHTFKEIWSLGESCGAECIKQDFTDVPIETCLQRDKSRVASVGEKVIVDMANKYGLSVSKIVAPVYNPALQNAIIVDLDGTLALVNGRNPFDRDFENDPLSVPIFNILHSIVSIYDWAVIITSGRNDKFKKVTKEWLDSYGVPYDFLYMRPDKDFRKDSIYKKEVYENHIKNKFNVQFVIDDRPQVVKAWRELGLFVFDVNQSGTEY